MGAGSPVPSERIGRRETGHQQPLTIGMVDSSVQLRSPPAEGDSQGMNTLRAQHSPCATRRNFAVAEIALTAEVLATAFAAPRRTAKVERFDEGSLNSYAAGAVGFGGCQQRNGHWEHPMTVAVPFSPSVGSGDEPRPFETCAPIWIQLVMNRAQEQHHLSADVAPGRFAGSFTARTLNCPSRIRTLSPG